jgi:two-component system chemotaxis response regulator CheB
MRASLRRALSGEDVVIAGEGSDGDEAEILVARHSPDVVLMDIVMPRMDGFAATRAVMASQPTPIVLISSVVATRDVSVAMEALRSGALAVADPLPSPSDPQFSAKRSALVQLLRAMSQVDVKPRKPGPRSKAARTTPTGAIHAIGIVASTGGPQVIDEILRDLPPNASPPILVVQHIAKGFTEGFASWLARDTGHCVVVANDGEPAERGTVYVAPEDRQLGIDAGLRLTVTSDPPIGVFRPSGTHLFRSLARSLGSRAAGMLLTGMGNDGAAGLLDLRRAGGETVAQDEASSVIFGMPRAAIELGAAKEVLPTQQLSGWIVERSRV